MRVCIVGFFGWGNAGDEGILQAMMDSLGHENEYVVCTTLPFNLVGGYLRRLPPWVANVRTVHDGRTDFHVLLLGGGGLDWGYGWETVIRAVRNGIPCINYGVGYKTGLEGIREFRQFLRLFKAVTVRDVDSYALAREVLNIEAYLTMCPAVNLKEEKPEFHFHEGSVVVCPRFEDFHVGDNRDQIDWIVNRLMDEDRPVYLIPFSREDLEGHERDLMLCKEIHRRLREEFVASEVLPLDGFSPRQIKYVISRSSLVVSGGRYHALVWAASHGVPYEVYPRGLNNYPKTLSFVKTHQIYGDRIAEMERVNVDVFRRVLNG
jgi:polysaccharide pyruvyl transferase WcaK-like protein